MLLSVEVYIGQILSDFDVVSCSPVQIEAKMKIFQFKTLKNNEKRVQGVRLVYPTVPARAIAKFGDDR